MLICTYCTYRVYTVCSTRCPETFGILGLRTRALGRSGLRQGRRAKQYRKDTHLELVISNSSGKPIYEQICEQIKTAIMTGDLEEGEQLPSIRSLANSLRVSAITTKRAYADLEATGFITTMPGKGSFVAGGNSELLREEQLREVEELLGQAVEKARSLGLTNSEVKEMLSLVMD